MADWADLLSAALGGGLVVKLADYGLAWLTRKSETTATARELVDKHLDPVLKAADELTGKIRSLSVEDFQGLPRFPSRDPAHPSLPYPVELANLVYLFAYFWGRIEILRRESIYVSLTADSRGKDLVAFVRCLESRQTRIVDRARQRALGELVLTTDSIGLRCLTFYEFAEKLTTSARDLDWTHELAIIITSATAKGGASKKAFRYPIITYGLILHAMVDHLDPEHRTTNDRPAFGHKLSPRAGATLRFRVLDQYLPFVENPWKYTGD